MITLTSNPNPIKKLAVVVVVMMLSLLVLQALDLLFLPSYMSFSYSSEMGVFNVHYYTFFQSITRYGFHEIWYYVNNMLYGLRNYIGIPIAALGATYILIRLRDPAHLLDKDHARHMLLIAYLLLIVSVVPITFYYSTFQMILFLATPGVDSVLFLFVSFLPKVAYIALSVVSVVVMHVAFARINKGVI